MAQHTSAEALSGPGSDYEGNTRQTTVFCRVAAYLIPIRPPSVLDAPSLGQEYCWVAGRDP